MCGVGVCCAFVYHMYSILVCLAGGALRHVQAGILAKVMCWAICQQVSWVFPSGSPWVMLRLSCAVRLSGASVVGSLSNPFYFTARVLNDACVVVIWLAAD